MPSHQKPVKKGAVKNNNVYFCWLRILYNNIQEHLTKLNRRLVRKGLDSLTTGLYIEGIRGKLQLAHHCIEMLRMIEHAEQSTIQVVLTLSTHQSSLGVEDQILFYCDSYWNILRSSLDILGQLINEIHGLGISERKADFNSVEYKTRMTMPNSSVQKALYNMKRSKAFKNLNEYRHCSTHRRQIFIRGDILETTKSSSGTPGYTYDYSGAKSVTIDRYLCNNPWEATPVVNESRPVLEFNEEILEQLVKRVRTVIKRLP